MSKVCPLAVAFVFVQSCGLQATNSRTLVISQDVSMETAVALMRDAIKNESPRDIFISCLAHAGDVEWLRSIVSVADELLSSARYCRVRRLSTELHYQFVDQWATVGGLSGVEEKRRDRIRMCLTDNGIAYREVLSMELVITVPANQYERAVSVVTRECSDIYHDLTKYD